MWPQRALLAAALSALAPAIAGAGPAPTPTDAVDAALDRLAQREIALADQTRTAWGSARRRARALSRMNRVRDGAFITDPGARAATARTIDASVLALRRDVGEARILGAELDRVRAEQAALAAAGGDINRARRQPPREGSMTAPVSGPVVGDFGLWREPVTGVQLRRPGVQLLARGGEPVRAVQGGTVRRIERASNGSVALVVAHPGRWTSIVTGLREASVSLGDTVGGGQVLGYAGRTLDGAPVVGLELWRGRTPVDPRPLLSTQIRSGL